MKPAENEILASVREQITHVSSMDPDTRVAFALTVFGAIGMLVGVLAPDKSAATDFIGTCGGVASFKAVISTINARDGSG